MKTLLAIVGAIALACMGLSALSSGKKDSNFLLGALNIPDMQLISTRYERHLFDDTDYYDTFRNKGGSGKVLLVLTHNNQKWKRVFYFDEGEQREVHYTLPGAQLGDNDTVIMLWKPVSIATAQDLEGALSLQ